jgi:hypothetical protein
MCACARNVILSILSVALGLAAADPAIGTWKLNVAKSKYRPGPAPKGATITYEASGDGVKRTGETVKADGQTTSFSYTAQYDGKDYPVTGNPNADTIVLKRINDYTSEATLKRGGKVTTTARRVVSKDGKTLTLTLKGTNAQGQTVNSVSVYEKQ